MKERLVMVFVMVSILCKSAKLNPLCWPGTVVCDGKENRTDYPSFSSKYRALEYDQTAMKLLMEMLLMQHNNENLAESDSDEFENSDEFPATKLNTNQSTSTPFTKNKPIVPALDTEILTPKTGETDPNTINEANYFMGYKNQINLKDDSAFQENIITTEFGELNSIDGEVRVPGRSSPADSNENRFDSTPTIHLERIVVEPYIELGMRNPGKLVAAVTTAKPTTAASVSKKILSSKYRDTKRTSTFNGPHVLLLHPRPFDRFTETLPSSSSLSIGYHREHFKGPTAKPEKKINSLKSFDRDQDVRGEIKLETLNRPINTGKPITTPPGIGGAGAGAGCEDATSCSLNNKETINSIKVKMGQKPAKVAMTTSTTTAAVVVGKPGIRYPNLNTVAAPSSSSLTSAPSKADDNLISVLASIVDSDEIDGSDEEDSNEEKDEDEGDDEEYNDANEKEFEYSGESDVVDNRKNVPPSKGSTNSEQDDDDDDGSDDNYDDDDDDDDTSSDVISSVMEEVDALI